MRNGDIKIHALQLSGGGNFSRRAGCEIVSLPGFSRLGTRLGVRLHVGKSLERPG